MEHTYRNFRIIVANDYDGLSDVAASVIAAQISTKPDSVLGLATGSTPIGTYERLMAMHKADGLDFSQVTSFNLDEYYPIRRNDPQSYNYFMGHRLFDHVNINPANTYVPNGEVADPEEECVRYEEKIGPGGLDLQLLGIGMNGHIGFNEPADHFPAATHLTPLHPATITSNSPYFDNPDDIPKHAITMGIGTIFRAKHILWLISGAAKADIARQVVFGPITPQVPGSALQLHPRVTLIMDAAAASKMERI
ncbi:MAG: glucosamine-6-phosphate deaminase [Defluviitaleaceae bacterium]|nr:glucosamine-6-phosphate deaminase [Defluviitaleaceae bacterium]